MTSSMVSAATKSFARDLGTLLRLRLQHHQLLDSKEWFTAEGSARREQIQADIERIRAKHWSRDVLIEVLRGVEAVNPGVWVLLVLLGLGAAMAA